jgi:uncharacterized protein YacL
MVRPERSSMVLHVLRTLFILLMGAVGWYYVQHPTQFLGRFTWLVMAVALAVSVFTVCVDILSPRRKLAVFSGAFFGLVVGLFIAYALSFVVRLVIEQQMVVPTDVTTKIDRDQFVARRETVIDFVNLLMGLTTSYLAISFILQTKDDFRFIIPFVEFAKQTRGSRPMVLDTSVLIDGRIADIAGTGIIESQLIVPRFVIDELQHIADSGDKLKRNRGRRGLDVVAKLQAAPKIDVVLYDGNPREDTGEAEVDAKLLLLARELNARVLTNDLNLNKVAGLRGVDVVNINQLANAVKPVMISGERISVRVVKAGDQPGQGVGFLDDGTMVVVEQGRSHLNEEVELTVTSALQTSAGRMVFGKLIDGHSTSPSQPSPTVSDNPALTSAPRHPVKSAASPTRG